MNRLTLNALLVFLLALTATVSSLRAASPRAPKTLAATNPAATGPAAPTSQPATRPSVNRTPALQHVADLALARKARSGGITAESRELFTGLENRDPSLFELMSDPDPEVRLAAVVGANGYPLRQFGPSAREFIVRAIPYLAEICLKDSNPPDLRCSPRNFTWVWLRDVVPDSCETICHFLLENDRQL